MVGPGKILVVDDDPGNREVLEELLRLPHRVAALMEDVIETEPVGELTLKGFHKPVAAYNVVGPRKRASRRSRAGRKPK